MNLPAVNCAVTRGVGVLILLVASACTPQGTLETLRQALHSVRQDHGDARRPIVTLPGYQDVRGVIHAHSAISWDSRGTPQEILKAARVAGLHWLAMTDHNNPRIFTGGDGGENLWGTHGDLLVIRGAELSYQQSSLLALNPSVYVDLSHERGDVGGVMTRAIRTVKAAGGLTFLAHPGRFQDWSVTGYDGMEIYDLADAARAWQHLVRLPRYLVDLVYSYDTYPEELMLGLVRQSFGWHPGRPFERWDEMTRGERNHRVVGIAGNDAHQNLRVFGRQLDPYALIFRVVNTHVIVPQRPTLDTPLLMTALGQGHAYVAFDLMAEAQGFMFTANHHGQVKGMMGDDIPLSPDLVLEITVPHRGVFRLVRDGETIRQEPIESVRLHPVQTAGTYRVEVWLETDGRWWPWIFSNPIYITRGPESSGSGRGRTSGSPGLHAGR